MAVLPLSVRAQRAAPRAPTPRPSAVSFASRVVAAPHSAIFGRHRALARSDAFGSTSCLTGTAFLVASLAFANAVVPLRVLSQCAAPRVPTPRPSAVSLASHLVAAPHSAIFGRRRARARSGALGSTSCLTVAAFELVSFAPANGGTVFVRLISMHVASRALAPGLGHLARVACRRGFQLGHLRST